MKVLVVVAHPLEDSYCAALAAAVVRGLAAAGHQAEVCDLYRQGFDPALTAEERRGYLKGEGADPALAGMRAALASAEGLVLVFPHWWFAMPAILKGWFDRAWAPGTAFAFRPDHSLEPRLTGLRKAAVVTTFGAPWPVSELVGGWPTRWVLRANLLQVCGRLIPLGWMAMGGLDGATDARRAAFLRKVEGRFARF